MTFLEFPRNANLETHFIQKHWFQFFNLFDLTLTSLYQVKLDNVIGSNDHPIDINAQHHPENRHVCDFYYFSGPL